MVKKYIIKNCPNCWHINRAISKCGLTYKVSGFKGETETFVYCKDINDCLLKRIVELCKRIDCDVLVNTKINNKVTKNRCGAMDNMPLCCKVIAKKDILRNLEIEEVE